MSYHAAAAGLTGHDLDVLKEIPALILMAMADIPNASRPGFRWPPAETLWRNGRAVGAPWTFGIEPDAVHQNPNDLKKANAVVIPWIAAVLRQRLSPDGNLRVVTDGAAREGTWLPDEQSAQGWRVVVRGSK